jgi:hypothetical protein
MQTCAECGASQDGSKSRALAIEVMIQIFKVEVAATPAPLSQTGEPVHGMEFHSMVK